MASSRNWKRDRARQIVRVLLTTQPGSGHWRPLAPVAVALLDAGHEVVFATMPWFCPHITRHGFTCLPMGEDDTGDLPWVSSPPSAGVVWSELFAGIRARLCLPDLIVREVSELAGCIAAEVVGIPHVAVQVSAFRPHIYSAIADPLARLRASVGLPSDPDLQMLYRHLLLTAIPTTYRDTATRYPTTARSYRWQPFDREGELPAIEWIGNLQRPRIYATLGTAYNMTPGVLEVIVDALRNEPGSLIITTGRDDEQDDFGNVPDNIRVERYIPQSLVFPFCDLVIAHGGFSTVMTALGHGLPMVIIPIAADQPDNARWCTDLRVAEVVESGERTPEIVRQAARAVLHDPSYRLRAGAVSNAMHDLPDVTDIVRMLERLVTEQSTSGTKA